MKPREIFLRSLTRQPVPRHSTGAATSVITTDLMHKTGHFFPEAHLDAEKMAALAAAGHTELGFDNVMPLFSVWHESAALGCEVDWGTPDRMPACRKNLYSITDTVRIPADFLTRPECRVPLDALAILKKKHGDSAAVVGKVFGPWTLGYHLFGVEELLINTVLNPGAVRKALETVKEATVHFGKAQIEAGADALCLADHATRDLCSPVIYREFLMPIHRELRSRLSCPLIVHICGDTSDRIPMVAETGVACFHFDSKVPARTARKLAGDKLSLMGGTSNLNVIRPGSPDAVRRDVQDKINADIDIIGPECAVPLDAPCAALRILTDEVKSR